jgi:hypothetical protein
LETHLKSAVHGSEGLNDDSPLMNTLKLLGETIHDPSMNLMTPMELSRILWFNAYEDAISLLYFEPMVKVFLVDLMGYKVISGQGVVQEEPTEVASSAPPVCEQFTRIFDIE